MPRCWKMGHVDVVCLGREYNGEYWTCETCAFLDTIEPRLKAKPGLHGCRSSLEGVVFENLVVLQSSLGARD